MNYYFKYHLFRFIFVPGLAGLITWYCMQINFTLDLKILATIFFAGIFFSFAITMNTANERRFQALDEISFLKSGILSIWQYSKNHLSDSEAKKIQNKVHNFFRLLQKFLHAKPSLKKENREIVKIDIFFQEILLVIEKLRIARIPSPEISRILQWHQQMYFSFEKLVSIKENRTPQTLRSFIDFALLISVFILAPEFAALGYFGVFSVVMISILIAILIKIQDMLEDPFGKDLDDVSFQFVSRIKNRLN